MTEQLKKYLENINLLIQGKLKNPPSKMEEWANGILCGTYQETVEVSTNKVTRIGMGISHYAQHPGGPIPALEGMINITRNVTNSISVHIQYYTPSKTATHIIEYQVGCAPTIEEILAECNINLTREG